MVAFSILRGRDVIWYLRFYLTVFRRGDLSRSPFSVLPGRGGTRPLRIYSMVFRRGDLSRSPFRFCVAGVGAVLYGCIPPFFVGAVMHQK